MDKINMGLSRWSKVQMLQLVFKKIYETRDILKYINGLQSDIVGSTTAVGKSLEEKLVLLIKPRHLFLFLSELLGQNSQKTI